MSVVESKTGAGYSATTPADGYFLLQRKDLPPATAPGIIVTHGHGGNAVGNVPFAFKWSPGYFLHLMALEGYMILAIDDMSATDWGSQESIDRINDAYAYLTGPLGAKPGKVGLNSWSMGGLGALNWLARNPDKCASCYLWSPVTDLEWAHAQAGWTAEVDAAYAQEGTRNGYSPVAAPASYRGICPIKVAHAADDATVPQSQSQAFVAAVNDPAVTMKNIPSGGHTQLFNGVSDLEFVQHWKASLR